MYALHTASLGQKQETVLGAPSSPAEGLELGEVPLWCDFLRLSALRGISVASIKRARLGLSVAGTDVGHDLQGFDALENSLSLCIKLMFGTVKKRSEIAIHFLFHFPPAIQIPTSQ